MTISKKLFLTALIGLGLQMATIRAEEPTQRQQIFNFAYTLQQQSNDNATIAGQWLEREVMDDYYAAPYGYYAIDKIIVILNAKLTLEEKIAYIMQIKKNKEEYIAQQQAQQDKWKKESEEAQLKRAQQEQLQPIKTAVALVAKAFVLPAITVMSLKCGFILAQQLLPAAFPFIK